MSQEFDFKLFRLVLGIHLAGQSQVCERQHFSMTEKRREGRSRGRALLLVLNLKTYLSSALSALHKHTICLQRFELKKAVTNSNK